MALEADVDAPQQSPIFSKYPAIADDHHALAFIRDYLRIMVSGNLNAFEIENLMDVELDTHHQEGMAPIAAIQRLGDALPAFGIVAAVLCGQHHGFGRRAAGGAGRHDRLGPGWHLPRHLAVLRHGVAAGRPAGAETG